MRALFLVALLLVTACKSEDPHPELRDLVIQNLDNQKKDTLAEIAKIDGVIQEHEAGLKKAVPQTGQRGHHTRKLFEAQEKRAFLDQQVQYLEIRMKNRVTEVRAEYKQHLARGEEWDPQKSLAAFIAVSRPNRPKSWSVKERIAKSRNPAKQTDSKAKGH